MTIATNRTAQELFDLTRKLTTAVVQAPHDLAGGSGTIYQQLNEFKDANPGEWVLLRAPVVLADGTLLAILIKWDDAP